MYRVQGANVMVKPGDTQDYALCSPLRSNLVGALFNSLPTERQLVVLDVGMAMAATVDLFSQFKSKLLFVDLYSEPFIRVNDFEVDQSGQKAQHQQLVAQFRQALGLDKNLIIDICLFWDFFNYLDATLLKAFVEALEPNIASHTLGYGLGVLNSRCQLPHSCYGLMAEDCLTQCPRGGEPSPVYPHSQRDLNSCLDYLEIDKSRLMSDGRVEYLVGWCDPSSRVKQPIF